MKAKTRPIYVIGFLLAGVFLVWMASLVPSRQKPDPFPTSLDGTTAPSVESISPAPDISNPQPVDTGLASGAEGSTGISSRPEVSPGLYFDYLRGAFSHPIEFYGKVVDEEDEPVADAEVTFFWPGPPPQERGSSAVKQTDAQGRFELNGAVGRSLSVSIQKEGYYFSRRQQRSFQYAPDDGNFKADPNKPVVFKLKKKGPGVELVTSQHGFSSHLGISPPKDGSPVWIDFFERKMGGNGQMEVRKLTPVWDRTDRRPHEWRLTLSIPDGGFVELTDDEFPFYPPETGYQPVLDFHFPPDREGWTDTIKRQYYVAFGSPRRYGRVKIEAWSLGGVRLEYVVNPDGRPYLEPKQVVVE